MITTEGDGSAVMPLPNAAYGGYSGEQQVSSSTSSFTTTPNVDQPVNGGFPAANTSWTADNSQPGSAPPRNARPGASIHRQMIAKSSAAYGLCGGGAGNSHTPAPYGYAQPGMGQPSAAAFQPVAAPMGYGPVAAPPAIPVGPNAYPQPALPPGSGFNSYAAPSAHDAPFVPAAPIQPGFISGSSASLQPAFLAQPPPNFAMGSSSSLNASTNSEGDKSQHDAANPGSRSDRPRRKSGGWNDPPLLTGSATSLSNSSLSTKSRTLFQKSPVASASGPNTPTPTWSPYPAAPSPFPAAPAPTPYTAAAQPQAYPYATANSYSYAAPPVANFSTNGQYHASPTL